MAIFAGIFAAAGRFVGRIVQMALGWATVLLFGRVPQSKQLLLSFVSLGSIGWLVVVFGIFFPQVAALLLGFVPTAVTDRIPGFDFWFRIVMLVVALILPLLIGLGGLMIMEPERRPKGGAMGKVVLRGYLYAPVLALTLLFLGIVAPLRKLRTIVKRWTDAHVPVVVKPQGYDTVATDLERALDEAKLGFERTGAPRVLELPAKLLAFAGGESVKAMVPDKVIMLRNPDLEVLIYPSDISIAGKKDQIARARAAIASGLTFTRAYLTTTRETQQIEDRLERISNGSPSPAGAAVEFEAIDRDLALLDVPYEEWEVLYRLRLQVERNLLASGDGRKQVSPGAAAQGSAAQGSGAPGALQGAAAGVGVAAVALPLILAVLERRFGRGPLRPLFGLLRRALA
jgi:hypothetical protein